MRISIAYGVVENETKREMKDMRITKSKKLIEWWKMKLRKKCNN